MAPKTLTLNEIDHLNRCMLQAKALVKLAGAVNLELLHMDGDDNLGKSMWAIADLLDEAQQIIDPVQSQGRQKNAAA